MNQEGKSTIIHGGMGGGTSQKRGVDGRVFPTLHESEAHSSLPVPPASHVHITRESGLKCPPLHAPPQLRSSLPNASAT